MRKFLKRINPYWAVAVPAAALAAAGVRWALQGSGNLYTDIDRRFYVPDDAIGWASSRTGAVWLGLDSLAVMALLVAAVAVAGWLIRRRESRRAQPWPAARYTLWPVAVASLLIPAWAFSSGGRPAGGRDFLPAGLAKAPAAGISARVAGVPAGTYRIVDNDQSVVAVRLRAGGEEFEARFADGLRGFWRGNPGDLTQPMTARVEVKARSVDTGIDKRSEHATEFLKVKRYPNVGFELGQLSAAAPDERGRVKFAAAGTIELMGARLPVTVTGLMWAPRGEALDKLGTGRPTLVISAGFSFDMNKSPLAGDMDSFDRATAPVAVTLVLALDDDAQGDQS